MQLKTVDFNTLFARSVLNNHVNGEVYADDLNRPRAYYVVHPSGMSLLYGDIKNSFLQSGLKDYILRKNSLRKKDESLQISPKDPENRVDNMLGDAICVHDPDNVADDENYAVVKYQRVNFKFNQKKFEQFLSEINLNQHTFLNVDSYFFQAITGAAVPNQFWDNVSKFTAMGVGFSLMCEEQPLATAFSSFIHDNFLEIGVETQSEHRKKGYASLVSAKLITYCLDKGLEPIWSCRFGNHGSYNLALKLGFEPVAYMPYCELL